MNQCETESTGIHAVIQQLSEDMNINKSSVKFKQLFNIPAYYVSISICMDVKVSII